MTLMIGTDYFQTSLCAKHFRSYSCICSSQQSLHLGVWGWNLDGLLCDLGRSHHNHGEPQIPHLKMGATVSSSRDCREGLWTLQRRSAGSLPGTGRRQWPDQNVPPTLSSCGCPEENLPSLAPWSEGGMKDPAAELQLTNQWPRDQTSLPV